VRERVASVWLFDAPGLVSVTVATEGVPSGRCPGACYVPQNSLSRLMNVRKLHRSSTARDRFRSKRFHVGADGRASSPAVVDKTSLQMKRRGRLFC
jgi:hypothetical protein